MVLQHCSSAKRRHNIVAYVQPLRRGQGADSARDCTSLSCCFTLSDHKARCQCIHTYTGVGTKIPTALRMLRVCRYGYLTCTGILTALHKYCCFVHQHGQTFHRVIRRSSML